MRAVVTGAAGMIGANLLHGLNAKGIDDILAVDDLSNGAKYANLQGARIADYFDKAEFYTRFARKDFGRVDAVLHQGACSDTMEHNGQLMMAQNYRCTKDLLDACQARGTRLIYADRVQAAQQIGPDHAGRAGDHHGHCRPFIVLSGAEQLVV